MAAKDRRLAGNSKLVAAVAVTSSGNHTAASASDQETEAMTKILLAACAALALSGCVTAEEMAAQDSEDCHSYGAATGTDAYFQCRMVKSQQHIEATEPPTRRFSTASTSSLQTTRRRRRGPSLLRRLIRRRRLLDRRHYRAAGSRGELVVAVLLHEPGDGVAVAPATRLAFDRDGCDAEVREDVSVVSHASRKLSPKRAQGGAFLYQGATRFVSCRYRLSMS